MPKSVLLLALGLLLQSVLGVVWADRLSPLWLEAGPAGHQIQHLIDVVDR